MTKTDQNRVLALAVPGRQVFRSREDIGLSGIRLLAEYVLRELKQSPLREP